MSCEGIFDGTKINCVVNRTDHRFEPLKKFISPRISRKDNSSCSTRVPLLQDLNQLLLDCLVSGTLRKSIFGSTLSVLISGIDLGVWPDCWVPAKFLRLPSLGRSRLALPQIRFRNKFSAKLPSIIILTDIPNDRY